VHHLSPGSASDDPEGQKLMPKVPKQIRQGTPLIMDRAYEGDKCRKKARSCGMRPVVPPKSNRLKPWKYDKELYKQRYIAECNFRNIKQCRRVFTRYDKLDETDNACITLAHACRLLRN
jgi:transposase